MKSLTVAEFLETESSGCEAVRVPPDEDINELLERLRAARRIRVLHVVDENERLIGVISWGDLVRHFFARGVYDRRSMHPGTGILRYITARHARDLMNPRFQFCEPQEEVHAVISRMLHPIVIKSIPVLDKEGRIIACLDILDLMRDVVAAGEGD